MPWQVPGYRPREDLAGGTGRVVLATDESTGELVVIKYLDPDPSYTADDLRAAIDNIGALPDDYFVRIRELVQDSGHNAIVMDPVNGTTMRALIRDDGPFAPESALIVFRDVLAGLTYAHALDIVHGNVSPENVMVAADGRPVMRNAGAAIWDPREPTLSSGVYLAPERWSGGPPTAAADVYAATVGFVESLAGEPPYWEDTDLERLRRRHESEDIDVADVPAPLRDVVRAGMAKNAGTRMAAAALLDLVETAATAGYGRDWQDRGRDGVIRRVRSGSVPFGAEPVVDAGGDVRDAEDVANDDFYADANASSAADAAPAEPAVDAAPTDAPAYEAPADGGPADGAPPGPTPRDAVSDAVMAAAAEIVAFAQLRDAAEADAILAASVDEELTEEEESAVAEIERLLFLDEQSPEQVEALTSEPADVAEGDAAEATPAVSGSAATAESIASRSAIGANKSVESAESVAAADPASGDQLPEHPEPVPAGAATGTDGRHRPWWLVAGSVAAVLVVAGLLAWAGVGLGGSGTRPAAASSRSVATATSPTTAPSASVPASAGLPPIGATPTGTPMSPPATASATGKEPSAGVSGSGSPAPTLPLTGFEHPIRLMAAIAAAFILAGTFLLYVGRRRDEATAGAQMTR